MTNPLNDPGQAARKIEDFLKILSTTGGLNLEPHILACNGQVQTNSSDSAGAVAAVSPKPQPPSDTSPQITVELSGPDTPLLLARNGELLHAIEHIAAKILRLERRRRFQGYAQPGTRPDGRDGCREGPRHGTSLFFCTDELTRTPHPSFVAGEVRPPHSLLRRRPWPLCGSLS
jgi:hypothetical protein